MKNFPSLKEREETSDMPLSSPLMPIDSNGETLLLCIRMQSSRSSLDAGIDFAVRYLLVQLTALELSQFRPTRLNTRSSTRFSNTSHSMIMPASSRSFMVIVPSRFDQVTSSACMSAGNSTRQTMNPMSSVMPIQIPPHPLLQASL